MKAKKKPAKKIAKPQRKPRSASPVTALKGWQQISAFLSQPVSVAQRWAKDGMPLKKQGRFVTATPEELNKWLGREVGGEPVQVATPHLDLSKELKRGLAFNAPAGECKPPSNGAFAGPEPKCHSSRIPKQ
jgi:hypothetical protein